MIRNLDSRHLNRFYSKKFKFFNISHSNRAETFLFFTYPDQTIWFKINDKTNSFMAT